MAACGTFLSAICMTLLAMSTTAARLLALLGLLQARAAWTGPQLAEELGVTGRTVRNDVERLRELGYPVDAQAGVGGGYRLAAGTSLPPLLLDDDEAVALAIGLRTAAGGSVTGIEESSLRALAKLDQVLPAHLRRRVGSLHRSIAPAGGGGPALDADLLVTVSAACRDREGLRFAYRTHAGETLRRTVEPHQVVTSGASGTWSPGTSTATRGAHSASTASRERRPRTGASRAARPRTVASSRTSPAGGPPRATAGSPR